MHTSGFKQGAVAINGGTAAQAGHGLRNDIGIMEKKIETTIVYWGYKGIMEKKIETTIVYWGYIRIMEKKIETTTVYWGHIGIMEKKMETTTVYWPYTGIMAQKMETTIVYWGDIGIRIVPCLDTEAMAKFKLEQHSVQGLHSLGFFKGHLNHQAQICEGPDKFFQASLRQFTTGDQGNPQTGLKKTAQTYSAYVRRCSHPSLSKHHRGNKWKSYQLKHGPLSWKSPAQHHLAEIKTTSSWGAMKSCNSSSNIQLTITTEHNFALAAASKMP